MHKCFCALRARAGESADIAAFCDGSDDDPSRRRKMTMPLLASGVHLKPAPGCAATEQQRCSSVMMTLVMMTEAQGGGRKKK